MEIDDAGDRVAELPGEQAVVAARARPVATIGGALGAGLESDLAVRRAASGYRRERRSERDAS